MKSVVRLDTEHVASLVSSINDLGFCLSEAKGIAVELIGSNAEDIRKYNSSLIQESAGFLERTHSSDTHRCQAAMGILPPERCCLVPNTRTTTSLMLQVSFLMRK